MDQWAALHQKHGNRDLARPLFEEALAISRRVFGADHSNTLIALCSLAGFHRAVDDHAATLPLELFRTDTEAYLHGLSAKVPAIYVVMRETGGAHPLELVLATASPYEAQDYADTGEEMVEKVPMPEGLIAWIRDFVELHHEDEVFIKRRRDKSRVDKQEDGIGDARIRQTSDVYRAPSNKEIVH